MSFFGFSKKNEREMLDFLRIQVDYSKLTERRWVIIEAVQLEDNYASGSQNGTKKKSEEGEKHHEKSFPPQHEGVHSLSFVSLAIHRVN